MRVPIEEPEGPPEDAQSVTRPLPPDVLTVKVCPLGHAAPVSARFCPECGQVLAEPVPETEWVCGLGHVNLPAAKYCPECGGPRPGQAAAQPYFAADPRPKPWGELTPEEQAERTRAHAEALRLGAQDVPVTYQAPAGKERCLIHFIEDGFNAFGVVWYRGQELELDVGSPRWWEAVRWIRLDEFAQLEKWGKVFFRPGPWRGKRYTDVDEWHRLKQLGKDAEVAPPSAEELAAAEQAEARRARGVPTASMR